MKKKVLRSNAKLFNKIKMHICVAVSFEIADKFENVVLKLAI